MTDYVSVKGAQEVIDALRGYPAKVEAKVIRTALAAGARVVRDAERAAVPVKTGALRDNIRVSSKSRGGKIVVGAKAGNNKKNGVFYAHFVLGGTKPHTIRVRNAKGLRIGGIGFVSRRSVQHPGARPNDFAAAGRAAIPAAMDAIIARAKVLIDKLNADVQAGTA
jgi:HK97 gp10 family phage protein